MLLPLDIVSQLTAVFFVILVSNFSQFLLAKGSILSIVDYFLSFNFLADLSQNIHQPFGQLKQLVVIAVVTHLQRQ
jgi:hypothetical protein